MTDDLLDAIEAAVLEGSLMELNDTMRQQTGQGLLEHVGETDLLDALVALTDQLAHGALVQGQATKGDQEKQAGERQEEQGKEL